MINKKKLLQASLYANIIMILCLFIGTIMTWLTKEKLLRQNAQSESEKSKDFDGLENENFEDNFCQNTN